MITVYRCEGSETRLGWPCWGSTHTALALVVGACALVGESLVCAGVNRGARAAFFVIVFAALSLISVACFFDRDPVRARTR